MEVDEAAKILWDYNHLNHKLEKADVILVLGGNDTRVAEHGVKLFLDGFAPLIIFSGGFGRLTGNWARPEAQTFADIAISKGIPEKDILVEDKSTNTGENIDFTKTLLQKKGIYVNKLILVQKPYMERRAYATFKKRWPEKEVIVSSPPISYEDYPNKEIPKDLMINLIVGDTQRNKLYGAKGFQIPQEVPDQIWDAYEELVKMGYTKHLVED